MIDVGSTSTELPFLITLLIIKGNDNETINGTRIIFWLYSGSGQDSFFLYQDSVSKGTYTMLCRSNPDAAFLLGDIKLILLIICHTSYVLLVMTGLIVLWVKVIVI